MTRKLPLIPRSVLFGEPKNTLAAISPDGTRLLYLAPSNGVLAIWIRTIGRDDDRVAAADRDRPIRNACWSADGNYILFQQDAAGDEAYHLFAVSLSSDAAPVDLTPYRAARALLLDITPGRSEVLVMMNLRERSEYDVHRVDLSTGAQSLVLANPGGASQYLADGLGALRAMVIARDDGDYLVLVRDHGEAGWRTLMRASAEDGEPSLKCFSRDGRAIYIVSSKGANAERLLRCDLATGAAISVIEDADYDITDVIVSAKTREPAAAIVRRSRAAWHFVDDEYARDVALMQRDIPGDLYIMSMDDQDTAWTVSCVRDNASKSFWLYDRRNRRAQKLFDTRPQLNDFTLADMTPITYKARDGRNIQGYLTLPPLRCTSRLPAVVLVHGGPWSRDIWGFNSTVQWLANRGYAVLQPNFRGSRGFGKAFMNAGDREWGGAILNDILDGKRWLEREGFVDPARVGIMGSSFGGYATLAALAFSPESFAVGVDIVGPSNLNTLLQTIPPYRSVSRSMYRARMGDDERLLAEQSPLHRADCIVRPLVVAHGANDPRVPLREAQQIVESMRRNGKEVTFVVFPDEGHTLVREENRRRLMAFVEAFLAKYLGGSCESPHPDEEIDRFLC